MPMPTGDLAGVIECSLKWQRTLERLAFNKSHHQSMILNSIDLRDIRVIQRRQNLCLARKASHPLGILREGLWKYFDRDVTMQFRVRGAIDLTHPSFAQLGGDVIVRDGLADHLFNPTAQFNTTMMGTDAAAEVVSVGSELIRNFLPSAVTS